MAPPRQGTQLEGGGPATSFQDTEGQPRDPRIRRTRCDDLYQVAPLIFPEEVGPFARVLGTNSLDDGPVDFRNRPGAELRRESPSGLARAREQDHSGRRPIEPMDQADEDVTRLVVAYLEILTRHVDQRAIAGHVTLGQEPRGLVYR